MTACVAEQLGKVNETTTLLDGAVASIVGKVTCNAVGQLPSIFTTLSTLTNGPSTNSVSSVSSSTGPSTDNTSRTPTSTSEPPTTISTTTSSPSPASVSPTTESTSTGSSTVVAASRSASGTRSSVSVISSSTATPSTGSTGTSGNGSGKSNTGLVAGVAVLAVVVALAFAVLLFVLLRRRGRSSSQTDGNSAEKRYGATANQAMRHDATMQELQQVVKDRDVKIKELQAALLRQGERSTADDLDDRQVQARFQALSQSINDWVLANYKESELRRIISPETVSRLQEIIPDYHTLLRGSSTKYLVIRGLVSDVLIDVFREGELIGSPAFSELNASMDQYVSKSGASEWRMTTVTMLDQIPKTQDSRAKVVDTVVRRIQNLCSSCFETPRRVVNGSRLLDIVKEAARLATDLARQRASYYLLGKAPGSKFDESAMLDALQSQDGQSLNGRLIRGVAFPAVVKQAIDMASSSQAIVIAKAQVIL